MSSWRSGPCSRRRTSALRSRRSCASAKRSYGRRSAAGNEAGLDRSHPDGTGRGFSGRYSVKDVVTYLNFDGQTKDAMEFYAKALGGELFMMKGGEIPGA